MDNLLLNRIDTVIVQGMLALFSAIALWRMRVSGFMPTICCVGINLVGIIATINTGVILVAIATSGYIELDGLAVRFGHIWTGIASIILSACWVIRAVYHWRQYHRLCACHDKMIE